MTNQDLKLPNRPTLKDFQNYVRDMEDVRGFSSDSISDKCLLLGEEVGELYKAVRKQKGVKVDLKNSKFDSIENEIADCLVILLTITNRCNADLEDIFRKKEEFNKQRTWEKSC
jgi:NTP pyrophosphatase (non-canonical NTP hydrolase)